MMKLFFSIVRDGREFYPDIIAQLLSDGYDSWAENFVQKLKLRRRIAGEEQKDGWKQGEVVKSNLQVCSTPTLNRPISGLLSAMLIASEIVSLIFAGSIISSTHSLAAA